MAKHWTQTPEGKRKMAAVQKKAWASRRIAMAKKAEPAPAPRKSHRALAKDRVYELTLKGARARISELREELEELETFVGFATREDA